MKNQTTIFAIGSVISIVIMAIIAYYLSGVVGPDGIVSFRRNEMLALILSIASFGISIITFSVFFSHLIGSLK